ncbi:hypothetical protein EDD17DRAFT_1520207 [Pisolithus thermaeus]|nr:hypothetical protein EDD17DRAFT_1520207 [Pisolithus thermaeus]
MPLPCLSHVLLKLATAGNLQTSAEMTFALVRTIARASIEQLEDNCVVTTDVVNAAHQGRLSRFPGSRQSRYPFMDTKLEHMSFFSSFPLFWIGSAPKSREG